MQKRSFCRCFWLLLSPQTKVARAGARNSPCAAAADAVRVGAGTLVVFGDYQIAPIAARSTAMGRWRLTPPWYGDAACGRDGGRGTPHPSASLPPVSLRVGRSAGLTRHRRVIQYRGPPRGKAWGGAPLEGKAWGDGGRSEKRLPWLGQAAAEASAPVSVHAVLLTDNGDERLCPREDAGNHSRP